MAVVTTHLEGEIGQENLGDERRLGRKREEPVRQEEAGRERHWPRPVPCPLASKGEGVVVVEDDDGEDGQVPKRQPGNPNSRRRRGFDVSANRDMHAQGHAQVAELVRRDVHWVRRMRGA